MERVLESWVVGAKSFLGLLSPAVFLCSVYSLLALEKGCLGIMKIVLCVRPDLSAHFGVGFASLAI